MESRKSARRGRLKVFLRMAPGVGKTCAMLRAGHELAARGVDVVVGLVEDHARADTRRLLDGLEVLPRKLVRYRDHDLSELDLDLVVARRPTLVLVDALAHTNAPGSRHPKHHRDVQELLDPGIDVYTTINAQHIESLDDIASSPTASSSAKPCRIRCWKMATR